MVKNPKIIWAFFFKSEILWHVFFLKNVAWILQQVCKIQFQRILTYFKNCQKLIFDKEIYYSLLI
jgi:hypothetical protein